MDSEAQRLAGLTDKEKEALRLLLRGLSHKEIGAELGISDRTVYQRLSRAADRVGAASSRDAAMILGRAEGLEPYAIMTHQPSHVGGWQDRLLTLLFPAQGRATNDLTIAERIAIIAVRTAFVAIVFLILTVGMRELGLLVGR